MAYSELIKNFTRIRDYMRDFYIYGFKHREEYDAKSARSYDNERRRIDSWLGRNMAFRQDSDGKSVFISIDSRSVVRNPLFKAFKTKSFTAYDIMLNFYILDALNGGVSRTTSDLITIFTNEYMPVFDSPFAPDESTVRNKLREYEKLGLLMSERRGKQLYYKLSYNDAPLSEWEDAIAFYSEEDPLGVIGSYLLDKLDETPEHFRFKHHYILHALESEILYELLLAIDERRCTEIEIYKLHRAGRQSVQIVTPLKILVSTQGGRRYLLAYAHAARQMRLYRLDSIKTVKLREKDEAYDTRRRQSAEFTKRLWGASSGNGADLEHIEMTIRADPGEEYIAARLEREKRSGSVKPLGEGLYRFTADVYDATEMLPWLRTFIGRIAALECSNKYVRDIFLCDLRAMEAIYRGGDADVVP